MPTVDDLVISLRIDDTSNLGKLQKQLTALVGPKGDKAIGLGMDSNLKRDLNEIKDRLIKLTPTVLVEGNLKEAAFALAGDLKKDTALRERLIQRNDITSDKFDGFIEELFNITTSSSELNVEQKKSFIAEMNKFRQIADMERGEIRTMIVKLTKLLQEATFHKKTVQALREAGIRLVSKPPVYEVTALQLKESKADWEDIVKGYSEKYGEDFKAVKKIFDENSDTLQATSEAVYKATNKAFDITNVSFKDIQDDDKLMMVLIAQIAAAMEKNQWILGEFYQAGQNMFTGGTGYRSGMAWLDTVVKRFDPEAIKQLGLKKVAGVDITTVLTNLLTEYKAVATLSNIKSEAHKRLIKQGYKRIVFIVEESSKEARNKVEELLAQDLYKGKEITLMEFATREGQKKLGIAPDLDEMQQKALESLEETKQAIADAEEKAQVGIEDTISTVTKTLEDNMPLDPKEQREYIEKIYDMQEGLMRTIEDVQDTVDITSDDAKKILEEKLAKGGINYVPIEKDPSEKES